MWFLSISHKEYRPLIYPFMIGVILTCVFAFPSPADDYKYLDRDYANPGAHQLASWIASQLRPKELMHIQEVPVIPYRLPLHGKRNSEVTNAIIGSEETQKMYRDGRISSLIT